MYLQTNIFLSENMEHVMQDALNCCHSCQDIKINSVTTLDVEVWYSLFLCSFKIVSVVFILSCPIL